MHNKSLNDHNIAHYDSDNNDSSFRPTIRNASNLTAISNNERSYFDFEVLPMLIIILSCIGLILCAVYIVILSKQQMRSSFNLLLVIIAVVHILEMLCWAIAYIIRHMSVAVYLYYYGVCSSKTLAWIHFMCHRTAYCAHNIDMCLIIFLAFLQCRCVSFRRNLTLSVEISTVVKTVAAICVLCLVYDLGVFTNIMLSTYTKCQEYEDRGNKSQTCCMVVHGKNVSSDINTVNTIYSLMIIVGVAIQILLASLITIRIKITEKKRKNLFSENFQPNPNKKAHWRLLAIIVCALSTDGLVGAAACYNALIQNSNIKPPFDAETQTLVGNISRTIVSMFPLFNVINVTANFGIYFCMSRMFRSALKDMGEQMKQRVTRARASGSFSNGTNNIDSVETIC